MKADFCDFFRDSWARSHLTNDVWNDVTRLHSLLHRGVDTKGHPYMGQVILAGIHVGLTC